MAKEEFARLAGDLSHLLTGAGLEVAPFVVRQALQAHESSAANRGLLSKPSWLSAFNDTGRSFLVGSKGDDDAARTIIDGILKAFREGAKKHKAIGLLDILRIDRAITCALAEELAGKAVVLKASRKETAAITVDRFSIYILEEFDCNKYLDEAVIGGYSQRELGYPLVDGNIKEKDEGCIEDKTNSKGGLNKLRAQIAELMLEYGTKNVIEVAEHVSHVPPLPKEALEQWAPKETGSGESPAAFIRRVYRPWVTVGCLSWARLSKLSPVLAAAYSSWIRPERHPEDNLYLSDREHTRRGRFKAAADQFAGVGSLTAKPIAVLNETERELVRAYRAEKAREFRARKRTRQP